MVSITLRVLSRPDIEHLPRIYKSLGLDYDERVLPSIGNEVLKSIVAQFDAAELITQREVVGSVASHVSLSFTQRLCVAGVVADPRRPSAACWRVQHQAGRCFYHTFDFRQGQCTVVIIPRQILTFSR